MKNIWNLFKLEREKIAAKDIISKNIRAFLRNIIVVAMSPSKLNII